MAKVMEVKNLSVSFFRPDGEIQALRDVSFSLADGEIFAIMGETGCGKSVLCKSILRLLPDIAKITSGHIYCNDIEITNYTEKQMRRLRGSALSMVFQNPMTALNPCMTIGAQVAEAVRVHRQDLSRREVRERVEELLTLVKLDHVQERMRQYPCQLSGGLAQRCVIAIALATQPQILFADEPTTALDPDTQAKILELFLELREKFHMAVVFVTHDPDVVRQAADRVALMQGGILYRTGSVEEIFEQTDGYSNQ